jgi:hypothetical protein
MAERRARGRAMIEEADLTAAVAAGIIDPETKKRLLAFARGREVARAVPPRLAPALRFDAVHVLYYAGALIVIGAMGLFSTTAFSAMGGWALTATAVLYAAGFIALGARLWSKPETRTPGGLAIAVAVSMAPLAIYGVQDALNLWSLGERPGTYQDFFPLMNASWVYMELGAIVASAVAIRFFPFPFIVMIASVALWFLSMDLALLIVHRHLVGLDEGWELRRKISLGFGAAMILGAWALDLKWAALGDFGFWLHLFGAMTFWGAVSSGSGDEFGEAAYCALNIGLIAFALFLNRRIYAVFGALGVSAYLGHLAFDYFKDVLAFTFALSAIGLAIIFAGILLQRHQRAISAFIDAAMPAALRALRPARALPA